MKLPITNGDAIQKGRQTQFGGLNHNLGAGDGELWNMRNLTSDYFPLLATRQKRRAAVKLTKPNGLFSWDALAWVDGTTFYYDGTARGTVEDSKKTFAALGVFIVILPDKKYYNTETGDFGSLESSWAGASLTFTNGTLYGEAAEANCIQATGAAWSSLFKPGDAVTISGCTTHTENNKTPIIREIDGDKLLFYEHVFTLDGEDGTTPYTETGSLSISRTVPDLKYLCENENRLWGCDDRTIYASKLGDIFNWNVYDGLSTDSYAVDTGSAGAFTACVSYLGYPIFFKEDHIYKVYGSMPSNFEVMGSATLGVASGSERSPAIAGETLFYLSTAGFVAYSGGIPQPIGQAFGLDRQKNAVGGTDGLKYYVTFQDQGGTARFCVYDARRGMWHIEDETAAIGFCRDKGDTYCLSTAGNLFRTGTILGSGGTAETDFSWLAEFADFTDPGKGQDTGVNKKGVSKIQIRLELDTGASCAVYIRFDSTGDWIKCGETMNAGTKRSYYLPIVPRRGDHYRIKIEGTGGCRVYSLAREYYIGSELQKH
jgi:hypothetical protein